MKNINQTTDFSVFLNGRTLPKYCLYGSIYRTVYYCADTTIQADGGIRLYVLRSGGKTCAPHWERVSTRDGYGAIFLEIMRYVKSDAYINKPVEFCTHKTNVRQKNRRQDLARKAQERRENRRMLIDAGAPKERRTQSATCSLLPTYSQSAVDGKLYSAMKYEDRYTELMPNYVGDDASIAPERHRLDKPFFENGQNTAGELQFMPKRDGMNTCFKNYRPEDTRTKVAGYVPKSGTLQRCRFEKVLNALNNRLVNDEVLYYFANASYYPDELAKLLKNKYKMTPEQFRHYIGVR